MAHIIHLDTSPRDNRSVSRTLSKDFISSWKAAHPNDTITYRDIEHYPVLFVSEDWIAAAFTLPSQHTPEQTEAIQISDELSNEVLAADR